MAHDPMTCMLRRRKLDYKKLRPLSNLMPCEARSLAMGSVMPTMAPLLAE